MASPGPKGHLARAEFRREEISLRRERRRHARQRAVTLQGAGRLAGVLLRPERASPKVRLLRPEPETESAAGAMDHEAAQGRQVYDVREKNPG